MFVLIAALEIYSEENIGESVVGTFKNICTVAVHCWYIKDAFAGFCQQMLEKNISEDILVTDCFHLNAKFISKSSSPL